LRQALRDLEFAESVTKILIDIIPSKKDRTKLEKRLDKINKTIKGFKSYHL